MVDQTDEFEMKPLTPGLGFHKRQVSLKEHMAKSAMAEQKLRRSLPSEPPEEMLSTNSSRTSKEIIAELHAALKPIEKTSTQRSASSNSMPLSQPLPRKDYGSTGNARTEIGDSTPHRPDVPPTNQKKSDNQALKNIDFQIPDKSLTEGVRRGASDNLVKPLVAIPVSFASIFLDAVIILAFSLIFLVSLITVTGVDLLAVIQSTQSELATQFSLAILYLAVLEMYVVVSRSFFGCTVGEWTFDLQMGENEQIAKTTYPLLVLWRSFLTLLTGVIFLPLLSFLMRTDLAAKFTGLQLYKKNI